MSNLVLDKEKYFQKIKYKPHPEQKKFHTSTARFKTAICGRRAGKSLMTARDLEPELLLPNRLYWLVGQNYVLGEKEFRVIWNDMMVKLKLIEMEGIKKAYNMRQGEMYIEFPWNTSIIVKSAERAENLVGDSLDGVVLCEACKLRPDAWNRFLEPSLSDKRGRAIITSTPHAFDFVYDIWQLGFDDTMPDYDSFHFPSWSNRVIYPQGYYDSEIQRMKRTMPDDLFQQEIAADFSAFVGKIYKEFTEPTHVKNHTYRPDWPNFLCIDFGWNTFAAVEFQVSPQDTVHVWREHYEHHLTLDEHFEIMKNRKQPKNYKIDLAFGDCADPEGIKTTSIKFTPCIGDQRAKQNWREGIDLVKSYLKNRPDTNRPAFYVDPSCKNTIKEFNNYEIKKPPKGGEAQDAPRKVEDHSLDSLRYGLMHVFVLGANVHLTDIYESPSSTKNNSSSTNAQSNSNYAGINDYSKAELDNHLGNVLDQFPTLEQGGFITLKNDAMF